MGLLDRVKAAGEQAVSTGQRQAQIVQAKRELSQAYHELGKTVHGLVSRGEVSHHELAGGVDKVNELQARVDGHGDAGDAADAGAGSSAGSAGEADIVE
jgi:hypothetical protein